VRRYFGAASLLPLVLSGALILGASPAAATFHLMQIREVYPGSESSPEAEYVELEMWAAGQNLVEGHVLHSYDAAGNVTGTSTFAHDVSASANQSTLLLATPQAEAQFGIAADAPLALGSLSPAGGAVCWETIDCVSWGAFSGPLPSPAGSPAAPAGIPDGMSLRRSIGRGCATFLDPADDSDDSAADFTAVLPLPRPNSVVPSERSCTAGGGSGGGMVGGGGTAGSDGLGAGSIDTALRHKPPRRTRDRTPSFGFSGSEPNADFECKLDRKPYRICRSPFTSKALVPGRHRFQVRARTDNEVDPTPAAWTFRVLPAR
jgi:hypothetical protein